MRAFPLSSLTQSQGLSGFPHNTQGDASLLYFLTLSCRPLSFLILILVSHFSPHLMRRVAQW